VLLYLQILSTYYQKKLPNGIKYVLLMDNQTEEKKEEGLRLE
jgi:hypothetical protein